MFQTRFTPFIISGGKCFVIGLLKKSLYPQTPQGGLYNLLDFNKSPLGDLGVS